MKSQIIVCVVFTFLILSYSLRKTPVANNKNQNIPEMVVANLDRDSVKVLLKEYQELINEFDKFNLNHLKQIEGFESIFLEVDSLLFERAACVQRPEPPPSRKRYPKPHMQIPNAKYVRYSSCKNYDQHWGREKLFVMILNTGVILKDNLNRTLNIGESRQKGTRYENNSFRNKARFIKSSLWR